jgi:ABC-type microcin C transport system permease subunit YejB
MDRESSTHSKRWDVMGSKLPKSEIVCFCQMIVVYVIIVTSIVNLSLQNGKNELWITLLSSAIGYALPSPTLKVAKP